MLSRWQAASAPEQRRPSSVLASEMHKGVVGEMRLQLVVREVSLRHEVRTPRREQRGDDEAGERHGN